MLFKDAPNKTIQVNGTPFVYRELGQKSGVPLVLLHHVTAVLDEWDPAIVDGLATKHHVFVFDNRGVGGSGGATPSTVKEMANDTAAFIRALGFEKADIFGFSLGGFVAQAVAQEHPDLVRKIIIAGSGPAGGEGLANMGAVLQDAIGKATANGKHPKDYLFFTQTETGQAASKAFLARLSERKNDLDKPITHETIVAQLTAIAAWGQDKSYKLSAVQHPVLVANGDHDIMAPTINSFDLQHKLPHATLSIFPNAGHGGIFQYHHEFLAQALEFLR
jgi:pimeloyl-ACP methyl ester carboxylesterase